MEAVKSTAQGARKALALPPQLVSMYGDFIAQNGSAVSQIESGLRSLTYFIPAGRTGESEIMSESLQSGIHLLSMYHDSLLARAVARLPAFQRPTSTPHNRYTKFWVKKSPTYHRIAVLIKVLQYTELLWEMMGKRRSEKDRWRVVILIEAVKAVCRLLLLRLTNSRPLLSPPLPEREIDPSKLDEQKPDAYERAISGVESPPSEPSDGSLADGKWAMPRTGLSLPTLPDSSDISSYLLSKVLTADDIKPAPTLLSRVSGKGEIAEWLYILRPLIYAVACSQYRDDKKSWRPWLLGLSIEWGARQLAKQAMRDRNGGGLRGLSRLEKEELRRRGWSMAWWLMRGAFYDNVTKGWIQSAAGVFKGKMLLDMVATVIEDYEFLWDEYYFPAATM